MDNCKINLNLVSSIVESILVHFLLWCIMRKLLVFLLILLGSNYASSQSLSVFNIDASSFPTVKANFFAFDAESNQITNLSNSDFLVKENGQTRTVSFVSCPEPKPIQTVSLAMSIDNSGSMLGYADDKVTRIDLGKKTARELCNLIAMPPSEFALQYCDDMAFILQDFTNDRNKFLPKIELVPNGSYNDFVEQLLNPNTGLLNIAKFGKYKRVAVIYTDAWWQALSGQQLQLCIDTCIKNKIQFFAIIYSKANADPSGITQSLKVLADATGGYLYDGITSLSATEDVANRLKAQAQGGDPCQIEWDGSIKCSQERIKAQFSIPKNQLSIETRYQSPANSIAKLEFQPISVKFLKALPGVQRDTTITVTAKNVDFDVTNITSSNADYKINPTTFKLKAGENIDLKVSYLAQDSGYTYCKFTFENNNCPSFFYARGGFPGKSPKIRTLKLTHPNGGQEFAVGSDTVITWEGVLSEDKVRLEYSTNSGTNWKLISDTASGFKYNWHIPNTPSQNCLVKITAYNDEKELIICDQVWMRRNLEVEYYRNGDAIPEVIRGDNWTDLATGAWCYYEDDPDLGDIYGKLYNWYAVNDPRGLAPDGWHIPSDSEWVKVEDCLDGSFLAGYKLKEVGSDHWLGSDLKTTNASGFTALPGGYRWSNETGYIREYGFLWTSTEKEEPEGWTHRNAWSRGMYYGNPNVGKNAYEKERGLSVRCVRDTPALNNQSDQSDSVFSIVAPVANVNDIDMKKCLVGSLKDSLITNLIINSGSVKFRVDSIYFSGTDAKAFQLASGFPKYDLSPTESKSSEINFTPNRVGIHNAIINIVTQSDTLNLKIVGEGVEPKFKIITKLLDYGQVELGKERVFQDTALIKNISNEALNISDVVQLGPNKLQFEVLSGGGAFTLQPNEIRRLTVRFKPISAGRTSGQIGFVYDGIGSPAVVQQFANGIGGLSVKIKNDSAYAGQARRLKLIITDGQPENIVSVTPNFEAIIRFQKTILTPIKKADRNIVNDSIYMNIKGKFGTSMELAQIPVFAGLGSVKETTIDFVDFIVTDNDGKRVYYEIEKEPGLFKLLGICEEGGTRLVNPTGKVEIMQIIPNPASDEIEINVNLLEEGFSTVSVLNSNGVKLREYSFTDKTGLQTININARDFDNGLYFIQLLTPTVVSHQKLMIVK